MHNEVQLRCRSCCLEGLGERFLVAGAWVELIAFGAGVEVGDLVLDKGGG